MRKHEVFSDLLLLGRPLVNWSVHLILRIYHNGIVFVINILWFFRKSFGNHLESHIIEIIIKNNPKIYKNSKIRLTYENRFNKNEQQGTNSHP